MFGTAAATECTEDGSGDGGSEEARSPFDFFTSQSTPPSPVLAEPGTELKSTNLGFEYIGKSESSIGQLRVNDDALKGMGIDIRLCSNKSARPFFNEGTETLLEHSLPELQSSRVLDTSTGVSPARNDGSCWVEVHEIMKRPIEFVTQSKKPNRTVARSGIDLSLKE